MRDEPGLAGKPIHLHWKPHRRFDSADATPFERRHDLVGCFVDVVTRMVKFHVSDGARGAANRLAFHSTDEANERLGVRKEPQDVIPLIDQSRMIERDKAYI